MTHPIDSVSVSHLPRPRRQLTVPLAAGLGLSLILGAGVAGAGEHAASKKDVLHIYSTQTSFSYTTAAGQTVSQPPDNSNPGDVIQFTDNDFTGNVKHHTKHYTGTDHGVCIFTTANNANCYVQMAI